MEKFDITVIGSGPGGYVCAIRCAQLGFKTAIVERYQTLGGTCLNVGCIPSKAWLDSSEHYFKMIHEFETHGIEYSKPKVNVGKMRDRVADVVSQNTAGIAYLMKKNKITVINGHATFADANTIVVASETGNTTVSSDKFVIATGSKPVSLPGVEIDKERVITSTEALKLGEIPKHMIVIGGGVIGMELGSVYARLGAKVSVVEFMDSIIATMDRSLGKELQKTLKKLNIDFYLKHKVTAVERKGKTVTVKAEARDGGKEISLEGDYVLVSTGRRPYTDNLGLDKAGVNLDERGKVVVDDHFKTSAQNIFAIGDVIRGAMLAHKAEEEGVAVAEIIAGQKPHINYNLIPGVVYTWPEVASVGVTEEELKEKGVQYKAGSFPFKASGRARASMDTDGFIKVLADKNTDEILGVHMIAARAADLIAEAVVAMEFRASAEDIARMSHAHPTYSEAMKEACLAATENRPIHI
ncbi:MAG: dihydrolipoyl dehydrogenase [Sphingobacteriales bacterium]|nr:MAG: dihydrolipoyl dehydrogenase [Sphingobacteriales bacterium]